MEYEQYWQEQRKCRVQREVDEKMHLLSVNDRASTITNFDTKSEQVVELCDRHNSRKRDHQVRPLTRRCFVAISDRAFRQTPL